MPDRAARFHDDGLPPDQRTPAQRDRDRILYTSALRRLSGITQVVTPTERHVLHNRLTHTLEVAQIGRRLAEKLLAETDASFIEAVGGIEPETVEAAALAHDLGHPPFGHIAERELDALALNNVPDGFDGNAQSFRILTKLAVRFDHLPGLNLTRATLNAVLKYPWQRAAGPHWDKWGAYTSEQAEFAWARAAFPFGAETRGAEAELMDWADDIAYAVHDLEDFYRAGLIPLDRLVRDRDEVDRFIAAELTRRRTTGTEADNLRQAFAELIALSPVFEPYDGSRRQRAALRSLTSRLIGEYVNAIRLRSTGSAPLVTIEARARREVAMLKGLTWQYVILNPALATQQHGQRLVIRYLFNTYGEAAASRASWPLFPPGYRELLADTATDEERVRIVIDFLASMTERQAIELYQRLSGVAFGSALDPIVT